MSSFKDVIATAQAAWLSNYTLGDKRWRLKQLHGLHRLVVDNRDEIVTALATETSQPTFLYEREIAFLVREIHSHICHLHSKTKSQRFKSAHLGRLEVAPQPSGVSLIISNTENFIRFGLAPFAASMAANNVVILATPRDPGNPLISCLQREWSKYLNPDTLQLFPGARIAEIALDEVDHVAIFDSSPSAYSHILQSPKAKFYLIPAGHNIAIIGSGAKNWDDIAQELSEHSTSQQLSSDRLSAVYVLEEDTTQLNEAWIRIVEKYAKPDSTSTTLAEKQDIQNCTTWHGNVYHLDKETCRTSGNELSSSLQACVERSEALSGFLVVSISSIDEAIDLLNQLPAPVHLLSLFSPGSNAVTEYLRDWIKPSIFSVGYIPSPIPLSLPTSFSTNHSPLTQPLFPSQVFSVSQLLLPNAPESESFLVSSFAEIRATYEHLIHPLEPEPKGERIGFFDQVTYALKGVAAVVGVLGLAGLWVGGRAVRRRWL